MDIKKGSRNAGAKRRSNKEGYAVKQLRIWLVVLFVLVMAAAFTLTQAENGQTLSIPEFTRTECVWNEDGKLISETAYSPEGVPAINSRGFAKAEYTWDDRGNLLAEAFFGLNGEPVVADSGYALAEYTYGRQSNGRSYVLTEDRYMADGSRAQIAGSYSYRRDAWDGDQILSSEYFDADGNLTRPTGRYARILYDIAVDGDTKTVTASYLDADGNPLLGPEGGATVVSVYTTNTAKPLGEEAEKSELGLQEDPGTRADNSFKPWKLRSTEIYSPDGSKSLGAGHWHLMVNTYDERDNLISVDYIGNDGEPIISNKGYASIVHVYDELDRVIETDYLGKEGQLIKMVNGYAKLTYEYYGESDLVHYVRYFGADGNRTMTTTHISMEEREYDGEDFDYRETYYDIVDEYTMSNGGFARIEYKYHRDRYLDEDDNELWVVNPDSVERERYFGTDMELVQRKAGYAGIVNEFNDNNQVIRTTYMSDKWQPVRNDERQLASIEYKYAGTSPEEPAVYEAYFDEKGDPCESLTGAYARSMVYGGPKQDLLLEEAFFTAEGEKDTNISNGAHKIVYTFDGNLLQTSVNYYDADGNPCENKSGVSSMLREYNDNGRLLWQATFDAEGNLVSNGGQGAVQVHTYDYADHHTGEKFYSADGTALTQGSGYASATYEYDADGNVTGINYFNADDEPALVAGKARIEREYNAQHQMVYEANFGADLEPTLVSEGY